MISVMIIDENPMFRFGLEKFLTTHDVTIVGDAQTGAAGLALMRQHKPQIVLINAQLPDMTGEAVCRCIDRRFPATRTIFFLSPMHWPTLSRLIETPAQGFLAKEACYASLEAIRMVQAGKTYLQPDLALSLLHYRSRLPAYALEKLSAREYEVFAMLAKGKNYEEISEAVPLSVKTVYNLKAAACKKLGIQTREEIYRLFP